MYSLNNTKYSLVGKCCKRMKPILLSKVQVAKVPQQGYHLLDSMQKPHEKAQFLSLLCEFYELLVKVINEWGKSTEQTHNDDDGGHCLDTDRTINTTYKSC